MVSMEVKLSILDLIPVRTSQTTAQALSAAAKLVAEAETAGYTRYWVAEHHNMPAVASTTPGVLIPYLAAGTSRIRLGSGGVMLPNHTALAVSEQFALLKAMFPGRIDLGIGRAPGSDQVTAYLLRGGQMTDAVERFEQDVTLARELLGAGSTPVGESVALSLGGRPYEVRATPQATSAPEVWLLGSSGFSAELAAKLGLPYAFAYHFGMSGIDSALGRYRSAYQPSTQHPAPQTLLPVNVVVGESEAEALRLAQPLLLQMSRIRTGGALQPQLTVEQADAYRWTDAEAAAREVVLSQWAVGDVDQVAAKLRGLSAEVDAEELMLSMGAGASEGDPLDDSPARRLAVRELGKALLG